MRLKIQPKTIALELEGMGDAEFWRIHLDDIEIATKAAPFTASSHEITLNECEACYHCAVPTIAVRRIANHTVVWFTNPDHSRELEVEKEDLRTFNLPTYEATLNGDASALPTLSTEDFKHILSLEDLPEWKEYLYTIPELPNDETGSKTLGFIATSIVTAEVTPLVQEISKIITVTFGFDIDRLAESIINFGLVNDELVFRFQSSPSLPLWLKTEQDSHDLDAIKRLVENAG